VIDAAVESSATGRLVKIKG